MSNFSNQVRKARQERGLSQRELAKRAGVALTTVQSLENDTRKLTTSSIASILAALHAVYPLDEELDAERKKAVMSPVLDALFPDHKKREEEEKRRWAEELPLLHKRIDLFKRYDNFRIVFDLVDRLRSMEEYIEDLKHGPRFESVRWVDEEGDIIRTDTPKEEENTP